MDKLNKFRRISMAAAESFDAWRVIPRVMLIAYGLLVIKLYSWYISIPTFMQQKCDAAVLQIFMTGGMALQQAQSLACTVVDVVGGPTAAQSAFVTTIIGLSTGIFGLYTSTGTRWEPLDFSRHTNNQSGPSMGGDVNGGLSGYVPYVIPPAPVPSTTPAATSSS